MNTIANYSVNAIKTFRARNGLGYSCNLLRDGKKVAEVLEECNGGELRIQWLDRNTPANVSYYDYNDTLQSRHGTVEESLFEVQVMAMPKLPARNGMPEMRTNSNMVIDDMVNDTIITKKVIADLKKNLTVKTSDGKLLTWKVSPTHSLEVLKTYVLKEYPDAQVMNDLSITEVMKLYKEAGLLG